MSKVRVDIFAICVLFIAAFGASPVFGEWVCFNDCVRSAQGDFTLGNVTSWTVHDDDTSHTSGFLKDIVSGVDTPALVSFSMSSHGLKVSGNSGVNPDSGTEADDVFGGIVDLGGAIVYYGSDGWYVDITFGGLDPSKKYSFAGTAVRGKEYTDRQSLYTLSGAVSAVNNSSAGIFSADGDTSILIAGDNSSTGYVVRWDDIKVADDGSGTGSFTIRAQASDYTNSLPSSDNDQGKAYPFGAFRLEETEDDTVICPASDLDGDCVVNVFDLTIFAGSWMATGDIAANFDGTGAVDATDFSIFAGDWLKDMQTGWLQVTITDPIPAGAQWRVDGGDWNDSGQIVKNLSVGDHAVEFADVTGWNKPADRIVQIVYNDTIPVNASYAQQAGSLTVTINDPAPVGAKWRIAGGTWQNSGETLTDLIVGTYTVEFADAADWDAPGDRTVDITDGVVTSINDSYVRHTGSIQVTLVPSGLGAQWQIDEGTWQDSGNTVTGLVVGDHTIEYSQVTGWNAPAGETVAVVNNETAEVTGTYTQQTGSVTVTILPAEAITAGARWRVDGGLWRDSGDTVSGLILGDHTVEYNDTNGWSKPGLQTVTIFNAQTTTTSGTYTQQTGSLQVTITAPVPSNAQWRVDGGAWQNSGTVVSGLAIGDHLVRYSSVSGWDTPAEKNVTIVFNQTTIISGTYIEQTGSVSATISPAEAIAAGAMWRVDGGNWRDTGFIESDLSVGDHLIEYNTITGWDAPASETVTVYKNQTSNTNGDYVQHTGSLQVTITAPAPAAAQWRIDGGSWNNSGDTISSLSVGDHLVEYSDEAGWDRPVSETVTITKDQLTVTSAAYIQQRGSLTVTIEPAEAITAGAQWRVDGGTWKTSGDTETGISVGGHTVEYGNATGWTTPGDESVDIVKDQTTSATGTYTQQTGSLQVMIAAPIPTGAQWQVDGGPLQNSGDVVSGLSVGQHTVSYSDAAGYDTPADEMVDIADGQTTTTTGTYVQQTGSVTVTTVPAEANGQWRIDGGAWNNSGMTVTDIAVGSHTIAYSNVTGWDTPATDTVNVLKDQTATASGTYIRQTGSLTVTITGPANAQWRIDGSVWNNSGDTVTGLVTGDHTVDYSDAADWNKPQAEAVTINDDQLTVTSGTYTQHTGSVRVTILPAQAIAAGVKWRIDGGAWQDSGTTVSALTVGQYTIQYNTITGWDTPGDEMIDIVNNQTTTTSGTYVQQTGSLMVTITDPAPAGAQWRVDGGAWQNSGATVTDLSVGSHTVDYSGVAGWAKPGSEVVTITDGGLTSTSGTYTQQVGSLTVTITGPANAQWRVDSGIWNNSGVTVSDLSVGSHTVSYSNVAGWTKPADETVTIIDGQTTTTTGTYIEQLGSLTVTITGPATARWQVDGGTLQNSGATVTGLAVGTHTVSYSNVADWDKPANETVNIIDGQTTVTTGTYVQHTGSLTVTITGPAGAQWRVDGGAWRDNGYTETGLSVGSHTVSYSTVADWDKPADDTVTIVKDQPATASGTYTQHTGTLSVTITGPAGAQWRVDGGTWRNSGYTETGLAVGGHTVSYSTVTNWDTPADDTITIVNNQTATATGTYTQHTGSVQITISPVGARTAGAKWRLDGGAWRDSGYIETAITVGSHTIEYNTVSGWDTPAGDTVTVVKDLTATATGTYVLQTGSLTVTITGPATAQWRVDGGTWNNSGITVTDLTVGSHTVEYSDVTGWDTPTDDTVTIVKDQTATASGTYVQHIGSLTVTITPAVGGQWQVDGGTWQDSGNTVTGLTVGDHTVSYSTVTNYDAPIDETVTIIKDQTTVTSGTYQEHTGSITVTITAPVPAGAQWRIDGGSWQISGATVTGLAVGNHIVSYSDVVGYDTPVDETLAVVKDQTTPTTATYTMQTGSLTVTIDPDNIGAQWQLDNGPWHDSGYTETGIRVGVHTVKYSNVTGWNKPTDETVDIYKNQTTTTTGTYTQQVGSLRVNISPQEAIDASAQWRVDLGPWRNSGYTQTNLPIGQHTIEYSDVTNWDKPTDETVTINESQLTQTTGTYVQHTGSLQVTILPAEAVTAGAQWRVTGSGWFDSGELVTQVPTGAYTIEYKDVAGWTKPADESITVTKDQTATTTGTYVSQIGSLKVTLEPLAARSAGAKWRVDSGAWQDSGVTVGGLTVGMHSVDYNTVGGWDPPANETVNITGGQTTSISRTYSQDIGSLTVTIYPAEAVTAGAQWRIDSGAWQDSGVTVGNLSGGWHTVEYSAVSGWSKPGNSTVLITDGTTTNESGTYIEQSYPNLIISEFLARNANILLDEDDESSDWIEIYNPTDSAVDLDGWYLSNNITNKIQWRIPAVSIAAGDFLVVFASGKNRAVAGSELHTSFSLGDSNEYLALVAPDGLTVVHEYGSVYPQQLNDISYGLAQFATEFVSEGAGVTYIVPSSGDAGVDWTTVGFDDSSWNTGKTALGFGSATDDGMVAYYSMDEGSGTTAHDETAGHDGTLMGTVNWVPGPLSGALGTAVEFGGANGDYISAGTWDPSTATGQLSISHWLYWKGGGATWQGSIGKRDTWASGDMMWQIELTLNSDPDGFLEFKRNGSQPAFGFTMPTNQWVHVAVTFDGATATMYRDGTFVGSDAFSFGTDTASEIEIGACDGGGGNPWNGMVDEVRLYDRALTVEEVQSLAAGGSIGTSLEGDMLGVNSSMWARIEFEVEDPAVLDALELRMKYEDGFVAYINGQEVSRRNAAGSVVKSSWNAAALSDRLDDDSKVFELIGLAEHIGLLVAKPAKNVLAIHGLNDNINNGEFLISPVLIGATNIDTPQYFTTPTPGAYNVAGALGVVDNVSYNYDRGFYTTGFDLELSTDTVGADIIYTLDGSTPSAANGTVYTGPITIDRTSTVRSVAVLAGYLDSKVKTHTYIFISDVLTQSPSGEAPGAGWPTGSVNGQVIDYGMDPDIVVMDSRYNTLVDDALLALPSISLVTNLENLWDPSKGIIVNAGNDGYAWERPVSAELINPDGSSGFQINAGLRIRGGYSRQGSNPKHAFRLFFRSEYGDAKLKYRLFGDEGVDEFDKVDLRTAQNYSWSFGGDSRNTMCREIFSRDTQRDMGQPYTRSRYYHLYLNGQYWGIFQTQERSEARYAKSYFGGQVEDYDVVKVETGAGYTIATTDGNLDAWKRVHDMAVIGFQTDEAYYKLQGMNPDGTDNPGYERLIEINNLIDYMINSYFVGDFDGPVSNFLGNNSPNNFYSIYKRDGRDGFMFFRHDAEHSLFGGWDRTGPWPAGETFNKFNPQWLHQQLTEHPDYRIHFADLVHKYFFNNGLLTPDVCVSRFMARKDTIDLAIIAESARWGDSKQSSPRNRNDHWVNEINYIVNSYFPSRTGEVLDQFKNQGWYPVVDAPVFNQNGGQVADGFNLTMSNPNGSGIIYYTTDGSDPRLPAGESSPGSMVTLIAENAAKRVFVPTTDVQPSTGSILAEHWFGISGTAVSDLTGSANYPDYPDMTEYRSSFEAPVDWNETFGTRIRGWLHPPTTDNYTFWIASDDGGELWLSTDDDPANKVLIAWVSGWTNSREWTKEANQQSPAISLVAGQRYYIEGMMKEEGGGDNLAVAWQNSTISRRVIAGQYLSPAGIAWTLDSFDDSGWQSGSGGVGFERKPNDPISYTSHIGIDVESDMYNDNATCYIRIPFTVGNPDLSALTLRMKYDDGFVAYLNGVEIVSRNFTGTPAWNSTASAGHADSAAIVFEDIDLSAYIDRLNTGDNILAIHGLNETSNSTDFLISLELIGNEISQGDVSPTATAYSGPVTLNESTFVRSRVFDGQWSASNEFAFAVGSAVDDLRITEIMYHIADPNEEYIELQNIGTSTLNINWVSFTNGIDFTFPSITLSPDEYVLVVRNISRFEAKYGTGLNIAGVFDGSLDNSGERITLVDAVGTTIHDFRYNDTWYDITDGAGFSLTIRDATADILLWDDNSGWRPSAEVGGSPGWDDSGAIPALGSIVVNEVLAHSHALDPDWIELHNTTGTAISIGGWFLSDSNNDLMKYEIAAGESIPANGYIVFYEDVHFGNAADPGCHTPFALSENGDDVYLHSAQGGVITGYSEQESFGATETDVSLGRYAKSTGTFNFVAMSSQTPGYANAYPMVGPVVIGEIMYYPSGNSDAEYVELHNISGGSITLYDFTTNEGWRFADNGGFELFFDSSVTMAADERILLVKNKASFNTIFTEAVGTQIFEWGGGSLSNGGERVQLSKPGDVNEFNERQYIRVDRVVYDDEDGWPTSPDGAGDSLNRKVDSDYGNDVINWEANSATPGW